MVTCNCLIDDNVGDKLIIDEIKRLPFAVDANNNYVFHSVAAVGFVALVPRGCRYSLSNIFGSSNSRLWEVGLDDRLTIISRCCFVVVKEY